VKKLFTSLSKLLYKKAILPYILKAVQVAAKAASERTEKGNTPRFAYALYMCKILPEGHEHFLPASQRQRTRDQSSLRPSRLCGKLFAVQC